jgi:transposase-like protein
MADKIRQARVAKVMDVGTFFERFGTDERCHEHLKATRWGANLERFACPACGHGKGWWLTNRRLVECCDCHHQASVTAGTALHGVRSDLWKWLWAIYQLAQDKKGIAAMELAKQVRVGYDTAWVILHKVRRAMRTRNERYMLEGLVEVDETYVGGTEKGRIGRGVDKKVPVAVALEVTPAGKPRRLAMGLVKNVSATCLGAFVKKAVKKGSTLRTDGWSAYPCVAKEGYGHIIETLGSGPAASEKFPFLHTFIGNLKRMILGTHHSVAPKHLDNYLAEFSYRANRRWSEANLFDRLVVAVLGAKPVTRKQLVTGVS